MPLKWVRLIALIIMVGWVIVLPETARAKRVYYGADGTPLVDNAAPGDGTPLDTGASVPLTRAERMARDAAAAAAAGYALGQTVKVEKGIIYKLARDPNTGAYTFKLYRRVVKTKPSGASPMTPPSAKDTEKQRREARIRESRRQAIAAAEATRVREAKRQEEEAGLERERLEQDRIERRRLEKKAAEEAMARAEEKRKQETIRQARIAAEDAAIRKAEADALMREQKKTSAHRGRRPGTSGRIVERGRLALSVEHGFFNRETVLKHRTVTTAGGTVDDTGGVGVKDIFYTDVHSDMLILRYGIPGRIEVFAEAGAVFETLDEVSSMEPAWAAGVRAALFRYDLQPHAGLFVNGSGRYYAGSVSGRFTDAYGFTYDKTSEFSEIEAGIEAGVHFHNLTVYSGLAWAAYTEDTVKIQSPVQPDGTRLNDRLEEQSPFIVKAGAEYRFFTAFSFYLEACVLNREGLLAGISCLF
ncbi:hypothetical protein JCM14469_35590 [Desulfatiferula olefinivorans]